jgi:hypothetical protein
MHAQVAVHAGALNAAQLMHAQGGASQGTHVNAEENTQIDGCPLDNCTRGGGGGVCAQCRGSALRGPETTGRASQQLTLRRAVRAALVFRPRQQVHHALVHRHPAREVSAAVRGCPWRARARAAAHLDLQACGRPCLCPSLCRMGAPVYIPERFTRQVRRDSVERGHSCGPTCGLRRRLLSSVRRVAAPCVSHLRNCTLRRVLRRGAEQHHGARHDGCAAGGAIEHMRARMG